MHPCLVKADAILVRVLADKVLMNFSRRHATHRKIGGNALGMLRPYLTTYGLVTGLTTYGLVMGLTTTTRVDCDGFVKVFPDILKDFQQFDINR